MKKIIPLLFLSFPAFAQQAPSLEQIDVALSMSRQSAANELAVKDQRIAALTEQLKKLEASCVKPQSK